MLQKKEENQLLDDFFSLDRQSIKHFRERKINSFKTMMHNEFKNKICRKHGYVSTYIYDKA
jgi:hypothetical protein